MKISAVILLLSFLSSFSFAQNLSQEALLENVVTVGSRLWVNYPDGSRGTVAGTQATGYILNKAKGLIVTNLHNITPCMQAAGEKESWRPSAKQKGTFCQAEIEISFPFKDSVRLIRGAKILDYGLSRHELQNNDDWAVLQVDANLLKNFTDVKVSARELVPGEEFFFVGFPAKPVGRQIKGDAYLSEGKILSKQEAKNVWNHLYLGFHLRPEQFNSLEQLADINCFKNMNVFFHDAPIYYGYSGSGLIDREGHLIGLVYGTAGYWNTAYGDRPADLNINPLDPSSPISQLSVGISMTAVCSGNNYCQ